MPVAEYFGAHYVDARERFRASAKVSRAALLSHELPVHRGLQGETLTIDVARLGAEHADCALILISGTHGVEGFCGSGCQVGFFADRMYEALPPSACALVIHALNPFGFSWLRRVNEDGVDVNRNFVDFSKPLPSSDAYAPFHDWLIPTDWQGPARQQADQAIDDYVREHGELALQTALTAGQYIHPAGLFYGGKRPTWSALKLTEILRDQLPTTTRRVAVLDLHTGLGPHGYGSPLLLARDAQELERARRWYGKDVQDIAAGGAVATPLVGSVADGIAAALPSAEITYIGLEFGTRPVPEVLTALRADHWMYATGRADEPLRNSIQRQMRDAFYCERSPWQTAVYGRTADFIFRACRRL